MTLGSTPTVFHLNPEAGAEAALRDVLRLAAGGHGPILVVADAATRASGWAPQALLALAEAFPEGGVPATVIDLELDDPRLHQIAGVANDEGIADALLFGASVEHLALPVPGRRVRLVPAGAFIPDPSEVLASSGWGRFLEEATANGGSLLLYLPAESAGGAFMDRVRGLISLQTDAGARSPFAGVKDVLAVVAPPLAGPASGEITPGVEVAAAADREVLIADLRARQQAALEATERTAAGGPRRAIVSGSRTGDGEREPRIVLTEPPAAEKQPAAPALPRTRLRSRVMALIAVFLIALLYAFWHYFGSDYMARRGEAARQAAAVAPAAQTAPAPSGEPLRYSVAIEAHPDLPTAARRADALAATEAGIGFYIAPILLDSVLYYRVMAGPMRDSASAATIMDTLVARGHKTGSSQWDVRSTPLTFLLAEFATRAEADERMNEIRRLDIPSYIVEMPYSSGPPRYRLYSGAYSGPAEADVMRQLLRSTGLADTLVLRTGRSSS